LSLLRAIESAKQLKVYIDNSLANALGGTVTELEVPEHTKNFKPSFDPSWMYMNFAPSNQWFQKNKLSQILAHYLSRLSDVEAPRNALKELEDISWINAYKICIHRLLE